MEDDDVIRALLIDHLKQHVFVTVEGARDGVEALHKVTQQEYAVVVLDLMMPKMSGMDFLDSVIALHSDPSFTALDDPPPVFIITSAAEEDVPTSLVRERCKLVRAVFRKPLDFARLSEAVERQVSACPGTARK